MGILQVLYNKTGKTLHGTELLPYLMCVVVLNSSALFRLCLVEEGLILMDFLPLKIEICQEPELSDEDRGKCIHYWFTGTNRSMQRKG